MAVERLRRGVRATVIGMFVNGLLATGKLVAGVFGHSYALVADAVESFADLFSSIVVWRGLVVAATPADEKHPYGHGKAEPIAAAIVAGMLLFAAMGITVQSVRDILAPTRGPAAFTLVVLVVVVVIKETLYRFVAREAASVESVAVHADAWHHRSDAITSLAAGTGIAIAVIGGPPFAFADRVAAIVAAGIIAWNGWRLLLPALDELMDATPEPAVVNRIKEIAETIPGVERVEKCIVRKTGYDYFVDMHVEVDPQMTVQRAHDIAHDVKDRIRESLTRVRDVLVHIEPAAHEPGQSLQ